MAATAGTARLTAAHRAAQARLAATFAPRMLAVWRLLDPARLDATAADWLAVAVPLVESDRRRSATLAGDYVSAFRTVEIGEGVAPTLAPPSPATAPSLVVTGPATVKASTGRGAPLDRAAEAGRVASTRAAIRHVLDGGRRTILDTVDADPEAVGWARVTSGDPCSFCAMLASRGPVYRSRGSASFASHPTAATHDGDLCSFEPVYIGDGDWPARSRDYRDLWDRSTVGLSGADARRAFRRAHEAA